MKDRVYFWQREDRTRFQYRCWIRSRLDAAKNSSPRGEITILTTTMVSHKSTNAGRLPFSSGFSDTMLAGLNAFSQVSRLAA